MKGLLTDLPALEEPYPICLLTKATRITRGPTSDVSKFTPGFMLQIYFRFSMLKSSVDLPRMLWLYVLLIHNPLDFHQEANVRIFKS